MKKRNQDLYSFNLPFPETDLRVDSKESMNSSADLCENSFRNEKVLELQDRLQKKRQLELTRVYSSIVERARHLFE